MNDCYLAVQRTCCSWKIAEPRQLGSGELSASMFEAGICGGVVPVLRWCLYNTIMVTGHDNVCLIPDGVYTFRRMWAVPDDITGAHDGIDALRIEVSEDGLECRIIRMDVREECELHGVSELLPRQICWDTPVVGRSGPSNIPFTTTHRDTRSNSGTDLRLLRGFLDGFLLKSVDTEVDVFVVV